MRQFGLIGYPISHSFSKKYFSEKFIREGIKDAYYELFPLPDIALFPILVSRKQYLSGLNVTIPHKEAVIPFLDELHEAAQRIGAVNVIKVEADGQLIGYNSDYYGFKLSLEKQIKIHNIEHTQALVLGTGGASKAVKAALEDLGISFREVSRQAKDGVWAYEDITAEALQTHTLIVNTTPLGMYPNTETCPPLPYEQLTPRHLLFDLVYNPTETLFMQKGQTAGAHVANGLEMLHLQAEKAWEIWNSAS